MKARREETGFASPLPPSHGPLRFVTSHGSFALPFVRNCDEARTKQFRDTEAHTSWPLCTVVDEN